MTCSLLTTSLKLTSLDQTTRLSSLSLTKYEVMKIKEMWEVLSAEKETLILFEAKLFQLERNILERIVQINIRREQ